MKKFSLLTVGLCLLFSSQSFSANSSRFELVEIPAHSAVEVDQNLSAKSLGEFLMAADQVIAFGKKVWTIVDAGRPVVTTSFNPSFSVLPEAAKENQDMTFYQMEGWSIPEVRSYRATYKNGFGMKVVDFEFSIQFQHSGSFNGKGNYLTGVTVVPRHLDVAWGYNLDASTKLISITNRNSKENPTAASTMQLTYTVKTIIKQSTETITLYVDGKGNVKAY